MGPDPVLVSRRSKSGSSWLFRCHIRSCRRPRRDKSRGHILDRLRRWSGNKDQCRGCGRLFKVGRSVAGRVGVDDLFNDASHDDHDPETDRANDCYGGERRTTRYYRDDPGVSVCEVFGGLDALFNCRFDPVDNGVVTCWVGVGDGVGVGVGVAVDVGAGCCGECRCVAGREPG